MRHLFIYILVIFSSLTLKAQIHEIGVFAGGANYIGDIGPTDYISPNKPAFGIVYKWNRSPRHSWRFSYTHGELGSRDSDSDVPSRKLRDYDFENSINEFSVGLEFNFTDFDLHSGESAFTPYVHTGLTHFIYTELYIKNKTYEEHFRRSQFSIPMTVGIKGKISRNFILGAEIGIRYSFTDNLDGSKPFRKEVKHLKFGNTLSNDWYVFSGFTLTYTFGQNPCFCAN